MDENASRAVFLGVSVFVAIITVTLILNFYITAKETASTANRYDITNEGNNYIDQLLNKDSVEGLELRYILNYYAGDEGFKIIVYSLGKDAEGNDALVEANINMENFLQAENQLEVEKNIRPYDTFELEVDKEATPVKIVAKFLN